MSQFIPCLNAITIKQAPLLDKISLAAETGYKGIELWANDIAAHEQGGGSLTELGRRITDLGLSVGTVVHLPNWMNATGQEKTEVWGKCREMMRQAKDVGSPYIIAGPPMGACDLELAAANYHDLCDLGRELGVKPAAEFLGFVEKVHTIPAVMAIVEGSKDPDGTMVMDSFHMVRGGSSLEDLKAVPGSRIAIVHVNDAPAGKPIPEQSDADRVMPGDGVIDLAGMFAILKESGYHGFVSLELFNDSYWSMDPREVLEIGLRKLQPYL